VQNRTPSSSLHYPKRFKDCCRLIPGISYTRLNNGIAKARISYESIRERRLPDDPSLIVHRIVGTLCPEDGANHQKPLPKVLFMNTLDLKSIWQSDLRDPPDT